MDGGRDRRYSCGVIKAEKPVSEKEAPAKPKKETTANCIKSASGYEPRALFLFQRRIFHETTLGLGKCSDSHHKSARKPLRLAGRERADV